MSPISRALRALLVALAVCSPATASPRVDDRPGQFWFSVYAGDRGIPVRLMEFKVKGGPASTLAICYVLATLSVDNLNWAYPDKDFTAGCLGDERLDVRELGDRARSLLPKE